MEETQIIPLHIKKTARHLEKHGRSRMPDLYDAVDAKANVLLREEFLKRRHAR